MGRKITEENLLKDGYIKMEVDSKLTNDISLNYVLVDPEGYNYYTLFEYNGEKIFSGKKIFLREHLLEHEILKRLGKINIK